MAVRVAVTRSNQIDPDPRVERLSGALSRGGYAVTIVGWDRSGILSRFELRKYGNIRLLPIRAGFGRGIGNLPQLLRWQLGLLSWLFRHRKEFYVIHACDFDTVLPALLIAGIWKKIVVYDIFDFYSAHLRATPRFIKWVVRRLELWGIGKVEAVILADEARREQIVESNPRRISVIYNTPEDRSKQIRISELEDNEEHGFSIAYVGLLQLERGLLELLEVMERHSAWSLDLAGFGGDETEIAGQGELIGNVRIEGRIEYERAIEWMAAADALIATYDPQIPNHRYASPNKLFEAMMLAKPIIVARGTNMDRTVEEHGCGVVVPYGDVPALEEALAKLASDPALRARLGAAGRRAYESTYSWDIMEKRLLDLYSQL